MDGTQGIEAEIQEVLGEEFNIVQQTLLSTCWLPAAPSGRHTEMPGECAF